MKKVSIIIPTYGRANRIEQAIESLLNQTYKNIEIIIVDDNSNESNSRAETLNKLQKYKQKIKIILMEKNSGACIARNKGIREATGEIITFLDDDDIYYPTKIEEQLKVLEEDSKIDFVTCNMKVYLEDKGVYKKDVKCKIGKFSEFALDGILYTPMLMIRKNKLLEVGLFTETPKYQDHLLVLKLLLKNMKYKIVNKSLFRHTIHSEERITYTEKYKEALLKLEEIENKGVEKFSELELELLNLKRRRLCLNALQNLEKRNYKNEFKLIFLYLRQMKKGFRKNDFKEIIKIILRVIVSPKKLEQLKFRLITGREDN